jgi:carbonic anhydrase
MRLLLILLLALPLFADGGSCPPPWGYETSNGPDRWGQMDPAWAKCDTGYVQSPIDLATAVETSLRGPDIQYSRQFPVTIQNTSHELKVWPLTANTVTYGNDTYTLVQFHFHVPAEHVIGTTRPAAELHFVHETADGKKALALAVFITPGAANSALAVLQTTPPLASCASTKLSAFTEIAALLPPADRRATFYLYGGSLTTPPCTEGVTFIVFSSPITATADQISALEVSGHDNARIPPQPTGTRQVQKSKGTP